jgi:hypothetical protein
MRQTLWNCTTLYIHTANLRHLMQGLQASMHTPLDATHIAHGWEAAGNSQQRALSTTHGGR